MTLYVPTDNEAGNLDIYYDADQYYNEIKWSDDLSSKIKYYDDAPKELYGIKEEKNSNLFNL